MIKHLRKLRIRNQLFLVAGMTMAVLLVIAFATLSRISGVIEQKNGAYVDDIIKQNQSNISGNYDDLSRIVVNIAYNPTIQDYLRENTDLNRFILSRQVEKLFANMKDLKGNIHDIVIIGDNGNHYGELYGDEFAGTLQHVFSGKAKPYFAGMLDAVSLADSTPYLVIGCSVYDLNESDYTPGKLGVISVLIDPDKFGIGIDALSNSYNTKFYVFDRQSRIMSSNDIAGEKSLKAVADSFEQHAQGSYSANYRGKSLTVKVVELTDIGGKMVSIVDHKELLSEVSRIWQWLSALFFFALFFLAIPYSLIIRNIVTPISRLMNFTSGMKSGNINMLKKRVELDGYAEISVLAHQFNGMLDEIDNLTGRLLDTNSRLYEAELLKRKSELDFLRSQINPHFLYNTLDAIKSISNLKGVPEVRDMAKSLAHMFRYSIKGLETVKLAEETEIVKSYMLIQIVRFRDRFVAEYDFTEEALQASVMKMILQPIVENAIFHGLEPKRGKGLLSITGEVIEREDVKVLEIKVIDDGVGMDEKTLAGVRNLINGEGQSQIKKSELDDSAVSIGLLNVNNRIRLTYGERYGISFESTFQRGTEVTIRIPYRRVPDDQSVIGG